MLKVSYTYVDMLINLYTLLPTDYIYLNVDIPIVFLKKWAIHGLFFFIFVFPIQLTVNVQYKFLPMTGFYQWTSGIGSDRSTN